jgi:hypothetical protein
LQYGADRCGILQSFNEDPQIKYLGWVLLINTYRLECESQMKLKTDIELLPQQKQFKILLKEI